MMQNIFPYLNYLSKERRFYRKAKH